MSRSLWKFPIFKPIISNPLPTTSNASIANLSQEPEQVTITNSGQEFLFFQNRASIITDSRVNHRIHVYNGLRWINVTVSPERVGHRVGEFSATRKRPIPKKKKQIKGKGKK